MASRSAATAASALRSGIAAGSAAGPSSLPLRAITTQTSTPTATTAADDHVAPLVTGVTDFSSSYSPSSTSRIALDRNARRQWRNSLSYLSSMGSTQTRDSVWKPSHTRLRPVSARDLTISHLLAATAQVGHSTATLAKAFQPWIYGTRHGVAQIDVEKATLPSLRRAAKVVREIVLRDGVVLFVGTQKDTQRAVISATNRLGPNGFHVTLERWMPGILTNATSLMSKAIMGSLSEYEDAFEEQQQIKEESRARHSPASENNEEDNKKNNASQSEARRRDFRLRPSVSKLATQYLQPDLLVVLNVKANCNAIREATRNSIPTIGIIDTDMDPRLVTYPIPANDESIRVQELIIGVLSKAGEEGRLERERLTALEEQAEKMGGREQRVGRRRDD